MKKLLILFLFLCEIAAAQNIKVVSDKKIIDTDTEYYYPRFSPDGSNLALTGENFTGLYIFKLDNNKIIQVTDKQGAGYYPAFSTDGSAIYYRWNEYEGLKKYSSLYSMNLVTNEVTVIESRQRKLSPPHIINQNLVYTIEQQVVRQETGETTRSQTTPNTWVCIENQEIIVYQDDLKTVLAPKGEGNYIWPELSPDRTKILFTFAGFGTFICDLEGHIISDLGYMNASKWLNDNWVVGTKDYDDGRIIISSDIYAISTTGQNLIQLTNTSERIEMYPDCLPGFSKIVYHTLAGDIYMMTLKFN